MTAKEYFTKKYKSSKYHNKKTYVDNIKFDSIKEANFYKELKLREVAREVKDIKLQPKFVLQESFIWEGKVERAIIYRADFMYFDIILNKHVVVDVKGMKTEIYKIKRKLFLLNLIRSSDYQCLFREVY